MQKADECLLRQETDSFMVSPPNEESDHSEPELNNGQLLSHTSDEFMLVQHRSKEIFGDDKESSTLYNEDIDCQDRLLDPSWEQEMNLAKVDLPQQHFCKGKKVPFDQELCIREQNSRLNKEVPISIQIKEEEEELWSSQESEQLLLNQETDMTMDNATYDESDHSEPEPNIDPLLYQNFIFGGSSYQEGYKNVSSDSTANPELMLAASNNGQNPSVIYSHSNSNTGNESVKRADYRKVFEYSPQISNHRTHTVVKPYACNVCEKTYSERKYLLAHIRNHTSQMPHIGDTGEKKITAAANVKIDLSTVKQFSCNSCGKGFSRSSDLLRHMKTHTGITLCSCGTCGKSFTDFSDLLHHSKSHPGGEPFSCELCGRGFFRWDHFMSHMRGHTGEKPFPCRICGKHFRQHCHLLRHMRIHTGEIVCSCEICGKAFSRKDKLLRHMKTHKAVKPLSSETWQKI
ncbi:uncharacterized protein KZ484_020755 isoform 2-T2 [Pholidichthys leucotaenia]